MPEARDRRVVPVDVAALYVRRRDSVLLGSPIFTDSTGSGPVRDGGSRTPIGRGGGGGGGNENTAVRVVTGGRGSGRRGATMRHGVLPSWYPRTPLRDITTVLRPIERRRTRLGEDESQQTRNLFSVHASGAKLEHNSSVSVKLRTPFGSKVPKIMLDIASPSVESSELTPQKQLLNSIDTVEKFVREEIQKLKGTPRAKKAEREKRVRTLLSMR
ncbi:hypothetical protein Lal_00004211 [Lupinus albus]|uniref:Uncharacterized protein n=1 Tax=Lupinus albus TaxID=3870 RepID=A0A6A5P9L1_LUPAL|nr:hypothetical protein Lalb_Chr15g0078851 [Lupinus albus]KAF1894287.1 hypothetical protein Lal_00004211 [Lupinus albus]